MIFPKREHESHKTESGFNNQVVVANALNMYVKNVNKQ